MLTILRTLEIAKGHELQSVRSALDPAIRRIPGVRWLGWHAPDAQALRNHDPQARGRVVALTLELVRTREVRAFIREYLARPANRGLITIKDLDHILATYVDEAIFALPEHQKLWGVITGCSNGPAPEQGS